MCGRKTLTKDIASIIHEMDIEECEANNYIPNYNIAPTQFSPILIKHNNKRRIKMMKWGLIPNWSKDLSIGSKMINARIETIMEKPSFNSLIHSNRCIVLVDGYYEWDSTTSQPYYLYHQKNKASKLKLLHPSLLHILSCYFLLPLKRYKFNSNRFAFFF